MVFKHFYCVFITTSKVVSFSAVFVIYNAIYGVYSLPDIRTKLVELGLESGE